MPSPAPHDPDTADLLERLRRGFAPRPEVLALALAGSRGRDGTGADAASDVDVYVYTHTDIPAPARRAIVAGCGGATRADLDQSYWGPCDEWTDASTGLAVDIVYFDAAWMDGMITAVLDQHRPSLGYTTCFWHTVRQSWPLHDPQGWFATLQRRCDVPYPEALRQRIVDHNHPLLRGVSSSYARQIDKARARGDRVALNHRVAGLLASYFDCLFAANALPHPGEKRLAAWAQAHGRWQPADMARDLDALLAAAATGADTLPGVITHLLDQLDDTLRQAGLTLPGGHGQAVEAQAPG